MAANKKPAPKKPAKRPARGAAPKGKPTSARQLPAVLERGFEAMMAAAAPVTDFIDSATVVEKSSLVGKPFAILDWAWHQGEMQTADPRGFVSVRVATEDGEVLVFNDGSTGVSRQLAAIEARDPLPQGLDLAYGDQGEVHRVAFLVACRRGLRVSNYTTDQGPASTYYLG